MIWEISFFAYRFNVYYQEYKNKKKSIITSLHNFTLRLYFYTYLLVGLILETYEQNQNMAYKYIMNRPCELWRIYFQIQKVEEEATNMSVNGFNLMPCWSMLFLPLKNPYL